MTEYDLTLMRKNVKLRDGVYVSETSSLRLVGTKYESYISHTSAVMYTFQNLNIAVNEKYELTLT